MLKELQNLIAYREKEFEELKSNPNANNDILKLIKLELMVLHLHRQELQKEELQDEEDN
jgi:hypothetical protein